MNNPTTKAHPFELAGMGTGPYRFVGMVSIPSASLAEQNPSAYNSALAELPRDLDGGCGTCRNCGKAISNICIVQDAQRTRYGVGSDCILKTDDASLGNPVKVALARRQRIMKRRAADQARERKHQAWLDSVCNDAGETNCQRLWREQREQEAARVAAIDSVVAKFGFLLPYLQGPSGGFCDSIANGISSGSAPRGRALDICEDIYGKHFGRRGSEAYSDACNRFQEAIQ